MTTEQLDELDALAKEQVALPWIYDAESRGISTTPEWTRHGDDEDETVDSFMVADAYGEDWGEYIVAARNALPELIAEIRRLRAIADDFCFICKCLRRELDAIRNGETPRPWSEIVREDRNIKSVRTISEPGAAVYAEACELTTEAKEALTVDRDAWNRACNDALTPTEQAQEDAIEKAEAEGMPWPE